MALKRTHQTITGVNIFVDGMGHLGVAEELKLPDVKEKVIESNNGVAVEDVGTTLLEKLEAEFTISEYNPIVYAELQKQCKGRINFKTSLSTCEEHKGKEGMIEGNFHVEEGPIKWGEKAELKVKISVKKYRLSIKGVEIFDIDLPNLIYKVKGQDMFVQQRALLQ